MRPSRPPAAPRLAGALPASAPPGRALAHVLAAGMLLDALSVSLALPLLPALTGPDTLGPAWPLTLFAAGFASTLPLGTHLAARLGRRRLHLAALAGFALTALVGVLWPDPWVLAAGRVLQGAGAALTAPLGLAVLTAGRPPGPARDRALAPYTRAGVLGFTTGLLLAGLLAVPAGPHRALALPGLLALPLLLAARRLLPPDPPARPAPAAVPRPPLRALAAGAVLLLALPPVLRAAADPATPALLTHLALAAVLLLALALALLAHARPGLLLPPHPGSLHRAALTAACLNGAQATVLVLVALRLHGAGLGPTGTALALLPAALPAALLGLFGGGPTRRVLARHGTTGPVAAGLALASLGVLLLPRDAAGPGEVGAVLPTVTLLGLALALAFTPLHTRAFAEVGERGRAGAVTLYQTAVQLGAVLVPAAGLALAPRGPDAALLVPLAALAAGLLLTLTPARGGGR
ncbi:MFS transporter (plasmid) [Streptomyces sp. BI20]|uniref:MFS transporter n=1 Tax=Streptomyces sp. BI20 TaxID=3403460 RepID=UPI003C78A91C